MGHGYENVENYCWGALQLVSNGTTIHNAKDSNIIHIIAIDIVNEPTVVGRRRNQNNDSQPDNG